MTVTAMATGHESADLVGWCKNHLNSRKLPFEELRQGYVLLHQGLFRRVRLSLGDLPTLNQPTGELVDAAVRSKQALPPLIERMVNFGRYLMISSSRPGGLPMNLQGIWNDQLHPMWDCDYHLDLNLEVNYWLAETCNLSDLAQPLFDWVEARVPQAKRQAADLYACRGIFFDIAGDSTGIGNLDYVVYSWPGAAGWVVQLFWRHWEYTGDRDFLERHPYLSLKVIASFYEGCMIKNAQRMYLIVPSATPENPIKGRPGWAKWTTISSTIDLEIARNVFTHLILASEILKVASDQAARWRSVLVGLPTPSVNQQDELVEWSEDVESDDPGHRHMSMFNGLFPGDRTTLDGSPTLAAAAGTALQHRIRFGCGQINGWSYPWLAALFARLSDANGALAQLDYLARRCVNDNLLSLISDYRKQGLPIGWFGGKKVFQIEAGLGTTAAIAEILLRSQGGTIRILPALLERWPVGSVSGLDAHGRFVVDVEWHAGRAERVRIHSRQGNTCRAKFNLPRAKVLLSHASRPVSFNRLPGKVIEFQTTVGEDYDLRARQPGSRHWEGNSKCICTQPDCPASTVLPVQSRRIVKRSLKGRLMTKIHLGIAAAVGAGLMQGNFTIPMKYMPRWNWENLWLAFNVFALVVLPWVVVIVTIPDAFTLYNEATPQDIFLPVLFGALWGAGNVFCGLGVAEVGTALGLSLVIGLAAATGTIIPLLSQPSGVLFSGRGLMILLGVALMSGGVLVCALAGMKREAHDGKSSGAGRVKGLVFCMLSGVMSASLNFAFVYGGALRSRAEAMGYSLGVAPNVVWTWAMAGSFLVNFAYCSYLLKKNRSLGKYILPDTGSYWIYCVSMAILLSGGIFIYGFGASSLGPLGASIGWAIFLCFTILAANVSGFATGEWKGARLGAIRLMIAGSGLLMIAAAVVGYAS